MKRVYQECIMCSSRIQMMCRLGTGFCSTVCEDADAEVAAEEH